MKPNDATRAVAEALPEINRRRMLLGLTATTATLTAAAVAVSEAKSAASDEIEENPELVAVWKQCRDAETEYRAAKDALGWLADEWKHLWPLAPQEILAMASVSPTSHTKGIEKDIIGRPILRETAGMTANLSTKFRAAHDRVCFYIDDPEEIANHLAEVRKREPGGRTPKSREKRRKAHEQYLAKLEVRLGLATEYHAETKRLREAAGVDAARERIKDAKARLEAASASISKLPSRTLVGLRLKTDILIYTLERMGLSRNDDFLFGAMWRLAEDTMDVTQHLNGKRSASPLPRVEGGAA